MKKQLKIALIGIASLFAASSQAAMIYGSPETNGSGNFTVYNTNTNTSTVLGTTLGNMGLSFDVNNVLHGVKQNNLYTVDLNNGSTNLVGTNTINGFVEAATFGLDGNLYAGTSGGGNLYTISTATGLETFVGAISGISDFDGLTVSTKDVTINNTTYSAGTLFAADSGRIYAIDINALSAELLYSNTPANESLAFGENGTLYGNNGLSYYTIDLTNGSSSILGGEGVWGSAVYGALSGVNVQNVSEPGSLALLMLLSAGFLVRRKG